MRVTNAKPSNVFKRVKSDKNNNTKKANHLDRAFVLFIPPADTQNEIYYMCILTITCIRRNHNCKINQQSEERFLFLKTNLNYSLKKLHFLSQFVTLLSIFLHASNQMYHPSPVSLKDLDSFYCIIGKRLRRKDQLLKPACIN